MWPSGLYHKTNRKIGIEEFHQIFLDLYSDLCLYAMKFVTDYEASKDIVQEVLATFWVENEKLINKKLIRPYLFKAVKNRALNYNRRERKKTGLEEFFGGTNADIKGSDSNDVVSEIVFKNLQKDLEDALDELPEQRCRIFKMSRMQNMKHKEIAKELNISPKTVETQIYRTLNFLREKLKHYLE